MTEGGAGCEQRQLGLGGRQGELGVTALKRGGIAGDRQHPSRHLGLLRVATQYPKLGYNPPSR